MHLKKMIKTGDIKHLKHYYPPEALVMMVKLVTGKHNLLSRVVDVAPVNMLTTEITLSLRGAFETHPHKLILSTTYSKIVRKVLK